MNECLNCCEEIKEGEEVYAENGDVFCCQEHLKWFYEDIEVPKGERK